MKEEMQGRERKTYEEERYKGRKSEEDEVKK